VLRSGGGVDTPEHRKALIAWAAAEGGGVRNSRGIACGRFNPLNTKETVGVGSFVCNGATVSFNNLQDGVRAAVYTWRGARSYQKRVGDVLDDPNSRAEDVIRAIGNPSIHPGDKCWACGPSSDAYIRLILANLASVSSYATKILEPAAV
jgi:hypothetical protein